MIELPLEISRKDFKRRLKLIRVPESLPQPFKAEELEMLIEGIGSMTAKVVYAKVPYRAVSRSITGAELLSGDELFNILVRVRRIVEL